ncbi:MAG: J domain-containing protein [Rhodospirillaceae bacterium]|nr:J domain-containing protein [Rhodospirillaceae bacterium]
MFADAPEQAPEAETRLCEWPGCDDGAEHKAPRSRDDLKIYYWFCLDHVRQYNKQWNYYDGMSDKEVEDDVRRDTTWDRPSWPFGGLERPLRFRHGTPDIDDYGAFGDPDGGDTSAHVHRQVPDTPEAQAMAVFDLTPPVTIAAIKGRYKELVKRHHPDANGGDKTAEEKFIQIAAAYETLIAAVS